MANVNSCSGRYESTQVVDLLEVNMMTISDIDKSSSESTSTSSS